MKAHFQRSSRGRSNKRAGFTLAEIMFAAAISLLVVGGFTQFKLHTYRSLQASSDKLGIVKDFRSFTGHLSRVGRSARDSRVYESRSKLNRRRSGESGDLVAFVWAEPESIEDASPNTSQRFFITRVVLYSREMETDEKGRVTWPVKRYERRFFLPNADEGITGLISDEKGNKIRTLVQNILNSQSHGAGHHSDEPVRTIARDVRGLAGNPDPHDPAAGDLFVNQGDGDDGRNMGDGRFILVYGELRHGGENDPVTNTFNFTITPRG